MPYQRHDRLHQLRHRPLSPLKDDGTSHGAVDCRGRLWMQHSRRRAFRDSADDATDAGCEFCIHIGVDEIVLFSPGRAELDSTQQNSLDYWITTTGLRRDKGDGGISVVTHAEWIAPGQVDLDLAKRRAEAIRDFLVGRGIPVDRIATDALGPHDSYSEVVASSSLCQNFAEITRW